jgi:hypothetical protein
MRIILCKIMKKLLVIAVAIFLLGIFVSSCKTHERCPAYSKVEKVKSERPS